MQSIKVSKAIRNHLVFANQYRLFSSFITLPKNSNQAKGLADYAIDFMKMSNKKISDEVYTRVEQFHTDSVICGISALALRSNAPNILRDEAIT